MKKVRRSFLSLITNTTFEGCNSIKKFCRIADSRIGFSSYIGSNCKIIGAAIGRYCSIGSNVRIIFGSHPTSEIVSTHPSFYSTCSPTENSYVEKDIFNEYKYADENKRYFVQIGNDVWIGDDVKIMQGVKISDGAIIAAGAMVVKDVAPYEIVGGIPAKRIKMRFTEDDIVFLMKLKWWERDERWIKQNAYLFTSIKELRNTLLEIKDVENKD